MSLLPCSYPLIRSVRPTPVTSSGAAATNAKQTTDGSMGGGGGFSGWQPPSSSPFLVDAHDGEKQAEQQP